MKLKYMERAIELAKKGEGFTNPNPLVGAVIVKDDHIIGEGYHQIYGGPHAEINALASIKDKKQLDGAEMYVTLEPCSHYGKTPPCANAIANTPIKKVYIGMRDPNKLVAGKGIEILKNNGIEVLCGILEEEVKKLNEIFIKYITTMMPFCILKTAMTLDGKIATYTGDSKWITNELSRTYVHQVRNKVSAIMVGIGTVLQDDPSLTTRLQQKNVSDPIRVIVDSMGRIPLESNVLNITSNAKTIVVVTDKIPKDKITKLKEKNAQVIITPANNGRVDLLYLFKELGKQKVDSILLEGGSTLNYSVLHENLVDKVISFIAPKIIGGEDAKTPVGGKGVKRIDDAIELQNIIVKKFNNDIAIEGYVTHKRGE